MSSYVIYKSDPAKNNDPIIVPDNTKNSRSTSLTLIGRNYPGYGQAIAEDLVHLLENFSAPTPPINPIEGQIWFDTSDPTNKKLRINDGGISGARWSPINGVFQQPNQPTNANNGDIWVDTANQQLKFYNGTEFILVGPSYSSETRTGSYPVQWDDTLGTTHNIIINYVNDRPIEILATESFTPNPVIDGFLILRAGLNVSLNFNTIYGVAETAAGLTLSTQETVSADNIMRRDRLQRMTSPLQILENSLSLQIGSNSNFALQSRNGYDASFINTNPQGIYSFEINNSRIMELNGATRLVKINSSATVLQSSGLEVWGFLKTSSSATVNTLYVQSANTNSTGVSGNAVQISGGVGIAGTLYVNDGQVLTGPLVIGDIPPGNTLDVGVLLPSQPATYDIGSLTAGWANVYANVFQSPSGTTAQFIGIASSATYLASPSSVQVSGDFVSTATSFRGGGLPLTINTSATSNLIFNRPNISVTTGSDVILIASATDNSMYNQKKRDFLVDINYQDSTVSNPGYTTPAGSLVPVGTILPWAGLASNVPPGWVVCDGTALPSDAKYLNLKSIIQQKYDPAGLDYLTPNLSNSLTSGTVPNVVQIIYIMKY